MIILSLNLNPVGKDPIKDQDFRLTCFAEPDEQRSNHLIRGVFSFMNDSTLKEIKALMHEPGLRGSYIHDGQKHRIIILQLFVEDTSKFMIEFNYDYEISKRQEGF